MCKLNFVNYRLVLCFGPNFKNFNSILARFASLLVYEKQILRFDRYFDQYSQLERNKKQCRRSQQNTDKQESKRPTNWKRTFYNRFKVLADLSKTVYLSWPESLTTSPSSYLSQWTCAGDVLCLIVFRWMLTKIQWRIFDNKKSSLLFGFVVVYALRKCNHSKL